MEWKKSGLSYPFTGRISSWIHCINLGATTILGMMDSVLDDGSISGRYEFS
jgi:hypothetical protein